MIHASLRCSLAAERGESGFETRPPVTAACDTAIDEGRDSEGQRGSAVVDGFVSKASQVNVELQNEKNINLK